MIRALLITMAVCGLLTWSGYIHWEANIVAFVAFQIGWMSDMSKEERERIRRNTPGDRPGLQ